MTNPNPATGHPASIPTSDTGEPGHAWLAGLWAQTHALRTLADLLDRTCLPGLSVAVNDDRINVQVPCHFGPEPARAAAVALLAEAIGTHPARETGRTATHDWITADGQLAGHQIHVFTPTETETVVSDRKGQTPS